MIVTRLMGGLGNQMFQYAAARALALRHRAEVRVDLWYLENYPGATRRRLELDCFALELQAATRRDLRWPRGTATSIGGAARELAKSILKPGRLTVLEESPKGFDARLQSAPDNVFLLGFWQSERYFEAYADGIRADFTFTQDLSTRSRALSEVIEGVQAVAIHVRRGDYAHEPHTNRFHGLLGLDYYDRALREIEGRVPDPHLFVFSDEPEWARRNLRLAWPTTYVDHNGKERPYEDLRLMSLCRHCVTANSSFSWWGAWLIPHADKIVIAPRQWFSQLDRPDLVPPSWVRV